MKNIIRALAEFYSLDHNLGGTIGAYYNSRKENRHAARGAVTAYTTQWNRFSQINHITGGLSRTVVTHVVNRMVTDCGLKTVWPEGLGHLPIICEMALFISMLDAGANARTTVQVYGTPMGEAVKPDILLYLDGQFGSVSEVYSDNPNNANWLKLLAAAADLPNFWHAVPAGTYPFGLSDVMFIVSH